MCAASIFWWLDYASLPEHEFWARLQVEDSGTAAVLDCDSRTHKFRSADDARNWLIEEEYSLLENIEVAEFKHGRRPLPPT